MHQYSRKWFWVPAWILAQAVTFDWSAMSNPAGLTVQSGSAVVSSNGSELSITTSQNAVLDWQHFNIAHGETTSFLQPSANSVAWNRIQNTEPSQIWGNLKANGILVLVNDAGFHFGPNSFVSAAGLIVSTAPVTPVDPAGGLLWRFQGPPPAAKNENYGRLQVGQGGSVFLIADSIRNQGEISAPHGSIGLLAAREVLISERPDGRGLSAEVKLPAGAVDQSGRLVADAGTVSLHARVVNQDGLIQADSVREHQGVIELVASDALVLGPSSILKASGSKEETANGGRILLKSSGSFSDTAQSEIQVEAGLAGGDGGFVEISAPRLPAIRSRIDGSGGQGHMGGSLRIDPVDIVIGNSGSDRVEAGSISAGDLPDTLNLDVNSSFVGFSRIELQASHNITLTSGTLWDLVSSTGVGSPGSALSLEAGNNIVLANGSSIVAGENWSVSLAAGRDFSSPSAVLPVVLPATGARPKQNSIYLEGTASIESVTGDITLRAGLDVTVAGGFVRSMGGGNLWVQALAGTIQTGTRNAGYLFNRSGYEVSPDLGGISTRDGGDVTLWAGQNITSFLPVAGGVQTDAGSGAFGAKPGNVTVVAGQDVSGHYVLRNGTGAIRVGRDAGTASRLLALSLVSGGWSVTAARDVLLQEVRNPNGLFNNLGSSSSPQRHRFDYAAEAYTLLEAGNSVQLRGSALPRYNDTFSQGMPPIYPGLLKIQAGAGGVNLGNDLLLFPSPRGNLEVTTVQGGGLVGTKSGELVSLVVSDSGKDRYREFGDFGIADHAATPVHLQDPDPVRLQIAGDMKNILLGAPKQALVSVGGDLVNSRFSGQNLHPDDETSLAVGGDILNRNVFTRVPLVSQPDFLVFDWVFPPLTGDLVGLRNQFFYDEKNGILSFQGRMTGSQREALLNLPVQVFNSAGQPVFQANGEPLTQGIQVLPAEVVERLYLASQDVPLNPDTGYRIGGGGRFRVSARNLDLGATAGIVSEGPRDNSALARYFTHGADLRVDLTGTLDMFSTTISSLNGGSIEVVAGGDVNVGAKVFQSSDQFARGIFTVDSSDVSVVARGDIHVNGSRIAAYDGGNVLVKSLEGDVDAGTGGAGSATVEKIYVDPITRQIRTYAPTIPGSGILSTTFPRSKDPAFPTSQNTVGDITVETPRGSIIANSGGVVQIPLNGMGEKAGTVTLRAGSRDSEGHAIYEGSIDTRGSGVIGSNVKLEATGNISGLVFARDSIDLEAQRSVNVTALAQGGVTVSAGGTVSGTLIGVGSVNASGANVEASLLSQNVTASGDVTSSQVGFSSGTAAAGASQGLQSEETRRNPAAPDRESVEESDTLKRLVTTPKLKRTVGRVTVILPASASN